MRSIVFADIDGTLIESIRNGPPPGEADVGAWDRDGRAIAVHGPRHRELLRVLSTADALVPVTGRSPDALSRVKIDFRSYAVVHHGSVVITPAGEVDRDYADVISASLDAVHEMLEAAFFETRARIEQEGLPLRARRQIREGKTIEVCVKSVDPTTTSLGIHGKTLEATWQGLPGARIHHNGNNLALLPSEVTKERAVRWVANRLERTLGPCVHFGAGDSVTDLGFLRSCDYLLVPRDSQIDLAVLSRPA